MKKELQYFKIEEAWGGSQEWFSDRMMRLGGCAAVTACDSCIFFDLYRGTDLYPFDRQKITKTEYMQFGMKMKPYLRPRWSGIDTLDIYMEGYGQFLADQGCRDIQMEPLSGEEPVEIAEKAVIGQIDRGFPVPCLTLRHRNPDYDMFEWHWFLLVGYEKQADKCMVKIVTYGKYFWVDLKGLWDTGHRRKGGLVLYHEKR